MSDREFSAMGYLGEMYALATAIVWASAVVLFRRSGESIPPFTLNLFRVGISSLLLYAELIVLGEPLLRGRSQSDFLLLAGSGIIGIVISDTLFHRALNLVGAGINAIVNCLYSPLVTLIAFVLLGERIGLWQFVGMGLVMAGIVLTTRAVPPEGATRSDLLAGIGWGAAAMVTLSLGVVMTKPVLKRHSLIWATTFRQLSSLVCITLVSAALPQRRAIWSVFKPSAAWRFSLPGTFLGSFLALQLWLAGMKHTEVATAAIINQTSTIFILVLASLFLREPFTARRWTAAALSLAGIVMVTLG